MHLLCGHMCIQYQHNFYAEVCRLWHVIHHMWYMKFESIKVAKNSGSATITCVTFPSVTFAKCAMLNLFLDVKQYMCPMR